MKSITGFLLLIKGFFLKVFIFKNASSETPMEAYTYGPGENYLLVGNDVYRLPDDFSCDAFLALQSKDVHQFEKCPQLTRSFFESAIFEE